MQKQSFLKIYLIAIISFSAFLPGLVFAQSDETLDRIVSQIESLYPPLEGYIIAVEGNGLTLDLKRGMAVKKETV